MTVFDCLGHLLSSSFRNYRSPFKTAFRCHHFGPGSSMLWRHFSFGFLVRFGMFNVRTCRTFTPRVGPFIAERFRCTMYDDTNHTRNSMGRGISVCQSLESITTCIRPTRKAPTRQWKNAPMDSFSGKHVIFFGFISARFRYDRGTSRTTPGSVTPRGCTKI